MPPLLLGLLPAPFDMGNVAMRFNGDTRRNAGVASIGTQVLATSLRRRGTLHHDCVKDDCQLAHIMPGELDAIAWTLNTRPLKSLGYRCPAELFTPDAFIFRQHHA
ncbi:MAG: hypothetical protein HY348_10165, partial [Nitrospira defluvii]|nr:hypothetical protein [Nitrospira defluvii]